jgi:hypothetical protein
MMFGSEQQVAVRALFFGLGIFQDAGVGSPPDSFHSQIFQPSILTADDLVARQKACTWMRKK